MNKMKIAEYHQQRSGKILIALSLFFCLLTLPSLADSQFRHEVGIKPFYIPVGIEYGRSGDGYGFILDYEYRFHKYFGGSLGYLKADYNYSYQSMTIYTVTGPRPGTLYKREVSLKGIRVGLRFRYPLEDQESFYVLAGGNIGFLKRDGKETSPLIRETSEDVNVFYVSFGAGMPISRLDLSGGFDIGGITGKDGGGFATLFVRLAYRF